VPEEEDANPPRAAKRGAPRTTAATRATIAAANGAPARMSPEATNAIPAAAAAAITARSCHFGEAPRTIRQR